MLDQSNVAQYLLQHELLSPRSLVEGDLSVHNASRRNLNFRVQSERGPGYLVKQGVDTHKAATLAHEAAMYRLFEGVPGNPLDSYLPRLHLHNPEEQVLVLELLPGADNLEQYHRKRGRFSVGVAEQLGRALATLHRLPLPAEGDLPLPAARPPWVLSLHHPSLELYRQVSAANLRLIATLQQYEEFAASLDQLRDNWLPGALTHNDLDWANILVVPDAAHGRPRIKLVDWELAGVGDPCWDVGTVFSEYLGFWLLSIPITGDQPPHRFLEMARYPLEKMQPAMRRLWFTYARHMGLEDNVRGEWLLRCTRYAAARLVHTAFEQSQAARSLTVNALCFLQVSFNMLQRPEEATLNILGIPL